MLKRCPYQTRQVLSAGLVAAGQARRFDIVRGLHAQFARLAIHGADKLVEATRVVPSQHVSGTVFRGHQGQVQHVAARKLRADGQARPATGRGVDIIFGHHQHFVQRQQRFCDHQCSHQLRDRGYRQHRAGVLAEQHFVGVLVDDQRNARLQRQLVANGVQTCDLTEGKLGRHKNDTAGRALGRFRDSALCYFIRLGAFDEAGLHAGLLGVRMGSSRCRALRSRADAEHQGEACGTQSLQR